MRSYFYGERPKFYVTWQDENGVAYDPNTVNFMIAHVNGMSASYTAGIDPEITNPSTGLYEVYFSLIEEGKWTYRWEAKNAAAVFLDARERVFLVRDGYFY